MRKKGFVSIMAIAAVAMIVAAAPASRAQEVHTITPHYPDHFKTRVTQVKDANQTIQGKQQTTHTEMVMTTDINKTQNGYSGAYRFVSAKVDSKGPDGQPTPQALQQKAMMSILTSIGPAQVTLDDRMTPLSIDNIEDIKPKIKQGLTGSGDAKKDAMGMQLYDAFVANLTPQTAAAFLKQMHDANQIYGQPLTLHKPVPMTGKPVEVFGGAFNLSGTITLDDWQEGKVAHVTTVIAPTDADVHTFLVGMINTMMSKMMKDSDPKAKDVVERMLANMHMSMKITCHSEINLENYVAGGNECDSQSTVVMDIAKGMPPEVLKTSPQLAQMPPITSVQDDHSIMTTQLVP